MMIYELLANFADLAKDWREEANRRRRVTQADPGADTLDFCAAELTKAIELARAEAHRLTVEQYASLKNVSPQTVRNWIKWKWLDHEEGPRGWLIDPRAEPNRKAS